MMKLLLSAALLLTAQVLAQSTTNSSAANATQPCDIKLFQADGDNYNALVQGLIQGLFVTPPEPCALCTKLER